MIYPMINRVLGTFRVFCIHQYWILEELKELTTPGTEFGVEAWAQPGIWHIVYKVSRGFEGEIREESWARLGSVRVMWGLDGYIRAQGRSHAVYGLCGKIHVVRLWCPPPHAILMSYTCGAQAWGADYLPPPRDCFARGAWVEPLPPVYRRIANGSLI